MTAEELYLSRFEGAIEARAGQAGRDATALSYTLMEALRRLGLEGSEWAKCQPKPAKTALPSAKTRNSPAPHQK